MINENLTINVTFALLYILIAGFSILFNLAILFVHVSSKLMRKNGSFVVTLSIGDVIYSLGLLFAGISRIIAIIKYQDDFSATKTSAVNCVFRFPVFFLSGTRIQCLSMLAIAIDRFLAVKYYKWYFKNHMKHKTKKDWAFGSGILVFALVSISIVTSTIQFDKQVSVMCYLNEILTIYHIIYHYSFIVITGELKVFT